MKLLPITHYEHARPFYTRNIKGNKAITQSDTFQKNNISYNAVPFYGISGKGIVRQRRLYTRI